MAAGGSGASGGGAAAAAVTGPRARGFGSADATRTGGSGSIGGRPGTAATATEPRPARTLNEAVFTAI
ncbi:hypothetical protein KCMC57_up32260 [Kitasatospora sp. CMC57]|uniref:Uncharacterized protein n=1 Tax=Kitasatospora sp. CMC57 TaxID=3231513 RepID=A0AB33JUG7_9ACTN